MTVPRDHATPQVRRDEGIPPYGCPDGRGHLVWLGVRHGLQGRGTPLPRNPVPPQTGPILNRPLQGFAMAVVTAVSRLLRASPPFVGADSISARGTPRRRGVPGWLPRSSHSVGRAFTPAAHWQFQNQALPRREHPREVHGPPLRTGTDATAIRLARNIKFIRRGGIYPARGRSRRRRVPGTMQASSPT